MGRHRKSTHSIVWDHVAIWSWPLTGIAGIVAGFMF